MHTIQPAGPRSKQGRTRRLAAMAAATAVVSGSLIGLGATGASAAPATVTDATFEWGVSTELQSAPPFGGCNYLSAGSSDGTEPTYQTTVGDVAIVKAGATPSWATKCAGAPAGAMDQKVVWSGGTGTVDPVSGETTLSFEGQLSVNFYGGLIPFTIEDPVVTVDAAGNGTVVATLFGYGGSMDDPNVKIPLDAVNDIVVADLSGVAAGAAGFTVTPDYAGVEYTPPADSGGAPQNRSTAGWGAWPSAFVDFHYETGLTSYWYHSGSGADPKKAPSAIAISYTLDGESGPELPDPTAGQQIITATVADDAGPGEFLWSIEGDRTVDLGTMSDHGAYLQTTGSLASISVTDTRDGGPQWSISGQVSDFTGGISGKHLGWTPQVLAQGAGAVAGAVVDSGLTSGPGLSAPSVLAAGPSAHAPGTARIGADLDLRLPAGTAPGTYSATLTITALS